jgi:anti-repressor protein
MNELIRVQTNDQMEPVISGRELHEFLGIDSNYTTWFKRMIEYGFESGKDFIPILEESTGGRPSENHAIKLDMAKEISMIQRNEKGKQARQYFISIEKEYNSPEKIMARALRIADQTINNLRLETKIKDQQIAELNPKATYYDLVLQSKDLITITAIAQDFGMSAQKLNSILEQEGVQYKQSGMWLLKGKYKDSGYTFSKTNPYTDNGEVKTKLHTYWTQAGRLFIYDLMKRIGILPVIER